jgi:hypothetical protein
MDRLEEEVDVALAAFGVGKGSAKMPEEEVRKIEIAYPKAFLPCGQGWRGSRVRCHDCSRRGPRSPDEVREDHRREGKGRRVRQIRLPWNLPPRRHPGQANTPNVLSYVMPLLHWAMPSKYHSIHRNDLARAMVAHSEQAFLAIAQGNAPKEATVKILEYKDMEPFFIKGECGEA